MGTQGLSERYLSALYVWVVGGDLPHAPAAAPSEGVGAGRGSEGDLPVRVFHVQNRRKSKSRMVFLNTKVDQ